MVSEVAQQVGGHTFVCKPLHTGHRCIKQTAISEIMASFNELTITSMQKMMMNSERDDTYDENT